MGLPWRPHLHTTAAATTARRMNEREHPSFHQLFETGTFLSARHNKNHYIFQFFLLNKYILLLLQEKDFIIRSPWKSSIKSKGLFTMPIAPKAATAVVVKLIASIQNRI
jgi:hypothetical protein